MIIPEGYAHVQHRFTGTGLPRGAAVTYGIKLNGGSWNPGDAALLHDAWGDTILLRQSSQVTLAQTLMKAGPNDVGPFSIFTDNRPGVLASSSGYPGASIIIEKNTALGGRKNRGRMYVPGISEADIDPDGRIPSGGLAAMNTQADAFLARIQAEVLQMVILHAGPGVPTVVTSLDVDPVIGTQRRRVRK